MGGGGNWPVRHFKTGQAEVAGGVFTGQVYNGPGGYFSENNFIICDSGWVCVCVDLLARIKNQYKTMMMVSEIHLLKQIQLKNQCENIDSLE